MCAAGPPWRAAVPGEEAAGRRRAALRAAAASAAPPRGAARADDGAWRSSGPGPACRLPGLRHARRGHAHRRARFVCGFRFAWLILPLAAAAICLRCPVNVFLLSTTVHSLMFCYRQTHTDM
jgi:hypothetical protein